MVFQKKIPQTAGMEGLQYIFFRNNTSKRFLFHGLTVMPGMYCGVAVDPEGNRFPAFSSGWESGYSFFVYILSGGAWQCFWEEYISDFQETNVTVHGVDRNMQEDPELGIPEFAGGWYPPAKRKEWDEEY